MSHVENESPVHEALVPLADVDAVGLGVGRRSLGRRVKNPPPGFPIALRINGRLYLRRSEIEGYKEKLIREALAAPGASETKAA
jgi:hypothetical protein